MLHEPLSVVASYTFGSFQYSTRNVIPCFLWGAVYNRTCREFAVHKSVFLSVRYLRALSSITRSHSKLRLGGKVVRGICVRARCWRHEAGAGAQQQMRAASRWQPTEEAQRRLVILERVGTHSKVLSLFLKAAPILVDCRRIFKTFKRIILK